MPVKVKSPFLVGPSQPKKGGPTPKSDEQIRKEQKANLSPLKNKLISAFDEAQNFTSGFFSDPTANRDEYAKQIPGIGGKLGALAGSGITDAVPGLAVAFGGGKFLPRLKGISQDLLKTQEAAGDFSRMPEWFNDWASYMMEKYPRVMAHQNISNEVPISLAGKVHGTNAGNLNHPKISRLKFNPTADPKTGMHETVHSLQRITEPHMQERYKQFNTDMGYEQNPFEQEAFGKEGPMTEKFQDWRNQYNPEMVRHLNEKELFPQLISPDIFNTVREQKPIKFPMGSK